MKPTKKKGVLAVGEATGHAHYVDVEVKEKENGLRVFDGATGVTHEEHKTVNLPNKPWFSDKVREWDSFAEEARRLAD